MHHIPNINNRVILRFLLKSIEPLYKRGYVPKVYRTPKNYLRKITNRLIILWIQICEKGVENINLA